MLPQYTGKVVNNNKSYLGSILPSFTTQYTSTIIQRMLIVYGEFSVHQHLPIECSCIEYCSAYTGTSHRMLIMYSSNLLRTQQL